MAWGSSWVKSNFFCVNNEIAFEEFMMEYHFFLDKESLPNGKKQYSFSIDNSIEDIVTKGLDVDPGPEEDSFYYGLRKFVDKDHAIIITEVGHDKLRSIRAFSIIITVDTVEVIHLSEASEHAARRLLNNPGYEVQAMSY